MKTYQIKYKQTEIWNQFNYNMPFSYNYGLADKTEVVETNNIKSEIEKIKKKALAFKSPGIFPNMKSEFVLKSVKPL